MRKPPSFKNDDTVILWTSCIFLAAILGAAGAAAFSVAAGTAPDLGTTAKEMLALAAAGVLLIVLAIRGRLVRAFLVCFALVFFLTLALTTHGFAAL